MNTDAPKPKRKRKIRFSVDGLSPQRFKDDKAEIKESLAALITRQINRRGMTQLKASEFLGIQQSRISDLVNHKVDNFTLDMLFDLLNALEVSIKINTENLDDAPVARGQIAISSILMTQRDVEIVPVH